VHVDLGQTRDRGVDLLREAMAEHAVHLAGVRQRVLARRRLAAGRSGERDEAVGAVAAADLAGVGVSARSRQRQVGTVGAPGRSGWLRRPRSNGWAKRSLRPQDLRLPVEVRSDRWRRRAAASRP
jgi:hypothetical protein